MSEQNKNMKKLDDMDKKNIFTTPEGYFDKLPDAIQSRIEEESKKTKTIHVSWSVRYAVAAAIVLLIAWFAIFQSAGDETVESLLADVSTDELVAYMEDYSSVSYLEEVQLDYLIDEGAVDQEKFNEIFEQEQDLLNIITEEEELLLEIDELI